MRWALLVVVVSCRTGLAPALAPPAKPELWVDASASEGGDGSVEHPLKTFAPREGTVMHLKTGLYPFSGTLPKGVELAGEKATVVLHAEGDAPFVLEATEATLRDLDVQGGQVGLEVKGPVTLVGVSFSGQRQAAVHVAAAGALTMTGGVIEGTVSETKGVMVQGRAELTRVTLKGALRRGVELTAGEASLVDIDSKGAATVLQATGGRATAKGVRSAAGRGPAFFVAAASLDLRDVQVSGHEYAVLTGPKAELTVDGFTSDRAMFGAFGLLLAKAVLKHIVVTRPGPHGAIESLEGTTQLEDVRVGEATELAVLVRHGRLDAKRVKVEGLRGGDAVMVRDATATLASLELTDIDGAGVIATAYATVELDGLTCTRCKHGALIVEGRSTVKARRVVSVNAGEAAVTVPDDAQLELDGLEVRGDGPAVWAECSAGSKVVLSGALPRSELMSGRCIEFKRAPPSGK